MQTSGDITVTQCYYGQPVRYAADSMTIEYTTAPDIHELWEKQFEPDEEEHGEKHKIEVEGLGRDAYWGGNRVSGALYVLAPRAIMRISIGGQGDVASKMERAKKVAMIALRERRTPRPPGAASGRALPGRGGRTRASAPPGRGGR